MSPFAALLSTLVLFESLTLPCGPVRRSSLFGYELGGDVLELEEAAAVADAWRPPPRPGLVRLVEAPATAPEAPREAAVAEAPAVDAEDDVLGLHVAVDDAASDEVAKPEPMVTYGHSEPSPADPAPAVDGDRLCDGPCDPDHGHPCNACAAAYFAQVDAELFEEEDEFCAGEAPQVQATVCVACNGGRRRPRGGCMRCDGRAVRLWIANVEVTRAPPRTDAERLHAAYALADLLRELPETAMQGARAMFDVVLRGAAPATRDKAVAQWRFAMERLAEAS